MTPLFYETPSTVARRAGCVASVVSLSIRLNDGHAAHLIKDGRRSHYNDD